MLPITLIFALFLYGLYDLLIFKKDQKKENKIHKKEIDQWKKDCPRTAELIKKYYG